MKLENSKTIEKDSISYKQFLIKSIIKSFLIFKKRIKTLRRTLYLDKKTADDKKEDDGEYLQDIILILSGLKEHYAKEIKYHDQDMGIESIRHIFDEDEDYYEPKLVSTAFKNNYFQYQTGSHKKICYRLLSILKRLDQI